MRPLHTEIGSKVHVLTSEGKKVGTIMGPVPNQPEWVKVRLEEDGDVIWWPEGQVERIHTDSKLANDPVEW